MSTSPSTQHQDELDAVVNTAQLRQRPRRQPNHDAENRALLSLAQMLVNPPRDVLQRLADATLELCHGGSAGISIIENHLGEPVFRWHALAGALASYKWETLPRDFSPCGLVIDSNAAQLMQLPERHFVYLAKVKPSVVEVLLVPFSVHGQPVGTIWVVAHDDHRKFDAEDERLVKVLGRFATKAYQLASSVAASKLSDRRKDEFLATIAQELRSPLSPTANAMPDCRGHAHRQLPRAAAVHESDEGRLDSLKHALSDLLERSRIRFEIITAASAPSADDQTAGEGVGGACDPRSLIGRIRAGDQRAFEEFYSSTVATVYSLALTILRCAEDAEEVVCDTYARAWRQPERFDAERGSPIGWLLMLCRSRAIDRLRYNRSRGSTRRVSIESVREPADEALTPEELLSFFHRGSRVQDALATLNPQRLMLVGLVFFEGLTFAEIATRTGTPIGTVKSHVRRALAELRRRLQLRQPGSMDPASGRRAASGAE